MSQEWSKASNVGAALMFVVGVAVAYIGVQYFQLPYIVAGVVASAAAILSGLVWNLIATFRGWKKIHWLDFIFSLLPWW